MRELGTARVLGLARCPRLWLGFWQGDVAPQPVGDREVPEVGLGMDPCLQLSGHHAFTLQMNLLAQVTGDRMGREPTPRQFPPSAVAPSAHRPHGWDLPGAESGSAGVTGSWEDVVVFQGWVPAGNGCHQGMGAIKVPGSLYPLSPQVSTLGQTPQAQDRPFLQPQRWLGSWVRQVWGCWHRDPGQGLGQGDGSSPGRG